MSSNVEEIKSEKREIKTSTTSKSVVNSVAKSIVNSVAKLTTSQLPSLWIETDMKLESIQMLLVLAVLGYKFAIIWVSGNSASIKVQRMKQYIILLKQLGFGIGDPVIYQGYSTWNSCSPEEQIYEFDDSTKPSGFDSVELDKLPQYEIIIQYIDALNLYCETYPNPTMVIAKPIRELLDAYTESIWPDMSREKAREIKFAHPEDLSKFTSDCKTKWMQEETSRKFEGSDKSDKSSKMNPSKVSKESDKTEKNQNISDKKTLNLQLLRKTRLFFYTNQNLKTTYPEEYKRWNVIYMAARPHKDSGKESKSLSDQESLALQNISFNIILDCINCFGETFIFESTHAIASSEQCNVVNSDSIIGVKLKIAFDHLDLTFLGQGHFDIDDKSMKFIKPKPMSMDQYRTIKNIEPIKVASRLETVQKIDTETRIIQQWEKEKEKKKEPEKKKEKITFSTALQKLTCQWNLNLLKHKKQFICKLLKISIDSQTMINLLGEKSNISLQELRLKYKPDWKYDDPKIVKLQIILKQAIQLSNDIRFQFDLSDVCLPIVMYNSNYVPFIKQGFIHVLPNGNIKFHTISGSTDRKPIKYFSGISKHDLLEELRKILTTKPFYMFIDF